MDNTSSFNPKISIIVPAYNIEKYIEKCLDSLINQTYKNIEIIVVNDGSSDQTGVIIDSYSQKDNRIIPIHKTNGGLSSARNAGLKKISGDYISFIDGDDFVSPQLYEKIVSILNGNKDTDLIQFGYREFYDGDIIPKLEIQENIKIDRFNGNKIINNFFIENSPLSVLVCDKIYKKELFNNIKFCEGKCYEDTPVSFEILFYTKDIIRIKQSFYNYRRMREGAITSERNEKILDEYDIIENLIDKYKNNKHLSSIIKTYSIDRLLFWFTEVTNENIPFKNRDYIIEKLSQYAKSKKNVSPQCSFGIRYIKYKLFTYSPYIYRKLNSFLRKIKNK